MQNLIILLGLVVIGMLVFQIIQKSTSVENKRKTYQYKKKDFFLSRAEHECYDALVTAVGKDFYIFAQVHLPTIVDNKVVGQNWKGAFRHINEKSVDFVLCDKAYIAPKLVIELDDSTHERPDRIERDREVERILEEAGLPLLRLGNHGSFNAQELNQKITTSLATVSK
jgi:very-short-patch-repair endonuclease